MKWHAHQQFRKNKATRLLHQKLALYYNKNRLDMALKLLQKVIQRLAVGWVLRIQLWKRNPAKTERPKKRISFASFLIQKTDCGIIHETGLTIPNTKQTSVSLHYKIVAPNAAYVWVFEGIWLEWQRQQVLSCRINTIIGRCKELWCFYISQPIMVWSKKKLCTIYYLLFIFIIYYIFVYYILMQILLCRLLSDNWI
jgi:hypothetical protein